MANLFTLTIILYYDSNLTIIDESYHKMNIMPATVVKVIHHCILSSFYTGIKGAFINLNWNVHAGLLCGVAS